MNDKGAMILLVDEKVSTPDVIQSYLSDVDIDVDIKVVHVKNGKEALSLLVQSPDKFSAVLIELMMQGNGGKGDSEKDDDGIRLLSKIKANKKIKNIPIIMQTHDMGKTDMLEGLNAGAYYYVVKPYNKKTLVSIVSTAVRDYQHYSQLKDKVRKTTEPLCMMKKGEFRFKSLNEGRNLAAVLSNACPNSDEVVLGLTELMINAVEHGNLGIGYNEKTKLNANNEWEKEVSRRLALPLNKDKYVSIEFSRDMNEIKFLIADQGRGFDWEQYMEISPSRIFDNHGRGIAMANLISFDQLEYLETGNKVSVTVSLQ